MKEIIKVGSWIYNYCTDFCINVSYLLGIDYETFGSLFFGFFMNGVILILLLLNIVIIRKKRKIVEPT
jgi:hypothetical protein